MSGFRFQIVILCLALGLILAPARSFAQATPEASPADAGDSLQASVDWLQSQQIEPGAWAGFSGSADVGASIDAVLALVAAEMAGADVDYTASITYLDGTIEAYADSGSGQAAKAVLVTIAIGENPENLGGGNLWEVMLDGYDGSTDLYGNGVYDTALVIMAYGARGEEVPEIVINKITELQQADGSWAFDGNTLEGSGDTNTTAIMIEALVSIGLLDTDLVLHAIEFLHATQLPQGFPFQSGAGAVADANSTGIVVQALISAGEDPSAQEWQNVAGSLTAFQNPSGSFSYLLDPMDENLFATVQIIPAIAGVAFPIMEEGVPNVTALPTCTAEQAEATPIADDELPCAA